MLFVLTLDYGFKHGIYMFVTSTSMLLPWLFFFSLKLVAVYVHSNLDV